MAVVGGPLLLARIPSVGMSMSTVVTELEKKEHPYSHMAQIRHSALHARGVLIGVPRVRSAPPLPPPPPSPPRTTIIGATPTGTDPTSISMSIFPNKHATLAHEYTHPTTLTINRIYTTTHTHTRQQERTHDSTTSSHYSAQFRALLAASRPPICRILDPRLPPSRLS